jgi:hypothetical protein
MKRGLRVVEGVETLMELTPMSPEAKVGVVRVKVQIGLLVTEASMETQIQVEVVPAQHILVLKNFLVVMVVLV